MGAAHGGALSRKSGQGWQACRRAGVRPRCGLAFLPAGRPASAPYGTATWTAGFCYVNDIVLAVLELLKYHQR